MDITCLKGLIHSNVEQSISVSCMALKCHLRTKHLTLLIRCLWQIVSTTIQFFSEVISVLKSIKLGKTAGSNGIPPETKEVGIPCLTLEIHHIMCLCREEGTISQDMQDAQLITLFRNKGSRQDCSNF